MSLVFGFSFFVLLATVQRYLLRGLLQYKVGAPCFSRKKNYYAFVVGLLGNGRSLSGHRLALVLMKDCEHRLNWADPSTPPALFFSLRWHHPRQGFLYLPRGKMPLHMKIWFTLVKLFSGTGKGLYCVVSWT